MVFTKPVFCAAIFVSNLMVVTGAQAFCTDKWADVTIICPQPMPYKGAVELTDTSRNLATVGTPGLYKNRGRGYDVRVYLHGHGTGYQEFNWVVQN